MPAANSTLSPIGRLFEYLATPFNLMYNVHAYADSNDRIVNKLINLIAVEFGRPDEI